MVRDWFFPSHAKQDLFAATVSDSAQDMRQRAVDKVNLWTFKAGRLAPAIVATASLTEATLHDEARKSAPGTVISDSAMQSIYAMAFARFVNGFVDRDIARSLAAEMAGGDSTTESEEDMATSSAVPGKGEKSMYAHAATIGMPQEFVDLRHQIAHGDIPNLAYLRQMTAKAMEWLWERWWVKHAAGSPDLAIRELGERRRISREAARASETVKGSSDMFAASAFQNAESLDGLDARDSSLAVAGATSRKRKSSAIEADNDLN